jgi:hypothetical protein
MRWDGSFEGQVAPRPSGRPFLRWLGRACSGATQPGAPRRPVQSLLRVAPILRDRKSVGHLHYFFKETAIETLQDCGYEIIDYLYTPRRLELPDLPLSAQLLKFPRKLLFNINADFAVRTLGGYSLLVLTR